MKSILFSSSNTQFHKSRISISPIQVAAKCFFLINITSYIGIFGCILILIQNFYLENKQNIRDSWELGTEFQFTYTLCKFQHTEKLHYFKTKVNFRQKLPFWTRTRYFLPTHKYYRCIKLKKFKTLIGSRHSRFVTQNSRNCS